MYRFSIFNKNRTNCRATAQLEWRDIHEGVIRLRPQIAKNKDGRMLMLVGEIGEIIARRRAAHHPRTPLVFYRERNGKLWPMDRFDKAWRTARTKAGIPEAQIFHDFRRTSVRNMTRAGVPEKVTMQIAGHKTRAIFDRYNITNEEDIRAGQLKTERHLFMQRIALLLFSPSEHSESMSVLSVS
jgi:hypothetical protein